MNKKVENGGRFGVVGRTRVMHGMGMEMCYSCESVEDGMVEGGWGFK